MAREITKLALKTVAITLLSIIGVALIIFLMLSFTAPAAMARLTRDLTMYKTSAWYSSLQYADGRGDIENIELAMNCCALAGDDEGVVKYGVKFIEDSRFETYCAQREEAEKDLGYKETYTQYVYGTVSVAYYGAGEGEKGIDLAIAANSSSFSEYNAVTDLVNEVILAGDKTFASAILTRLTTLKESGGIADMQYLDKTIENLTMFTL